MDKKALSERDICTKFITPALERAGWDIQTQVREEVSFTAGRIIVRGRMHIRGKRRRADYLLNYHKDQPIAVIEAKDNKHGLGDGMQQALAYADALDVPFVFTSNGDGFLCHDRTGLGSQTETVLGLDDFPSPEMLWECYCRYRGLGPSERPVVEQPYYDDGSGRSPRYYQRVAINRTVEAVARGQQRILLVMATGTGKTFTAFQIIWRLWKAKQKKRILFLADRNILVDQTKNNDFKPFGQAMTKVSNRTVDKSYEVYLSLYQAVTGSEEEQDIYRQFSPDFFDLVIIDECHRGSAAVDSAWRRVLDYFASATHIGLTATPKETKEVSNSDYFGEPLYTYSLKQGIEDGFLAPYKVIRVDIDRDLQGWRPSKGQRDKLGQEIEDRIYNQKDFDRQMVLEPRTELVALKITEFLEGSDPYQKTIIFCEDIDHAERMRQALVNLNPKRVAENRKYVMRITGDEAEGKAELDNFINPEERYPVIATTSKLMTTGVDAQTCKLIVLDQRIQSMTEFKQIIGRGTRINDDYQKHWFTILDFKKATELFADPEFDGDPVKVYQPYPDDPITPDDEQAQSDVVPNGVEDTHAEYDVEEGATWQSDDSTAIPGGSLFDKDGGQGRRVKYVVNDVKVSVVAERVQYLGPDGKLITESLRDYTRQKVKEQFASLDDFLRRWHEAERKQAILDELAEQGIFWDELIAELGRKLGDEPDPFDVICHIAFDRPPLTRRERADQVKKRDIFSRYEGQARKVLESLVEKYTDAGITPIEDPKVLTLAPFSAIGAPMELVKAFGGKAGYTRAVHELEDALYQFGG
ncbi:MULTISPECIES: EcoAI/FtnUII family type I restriction enzme subunit R [unclassified Ectothiorhodospira]|uniref:EcoAI/FtnUII family type I restriction enzme subunit R n=1 Tax=unclassified Ectothiorhodospira TaxID=2684909 RepID=UPI001EE8F923|nr:MULTISPECIES: DEAD/DEAH box helicase family protein [unclassified Ectothiorhodospira]MCG5515664.1 DEAD/DEAH box helicase family protein [Ectothiorhodospira sp. 9100]MCG5518552.1 DEAD/DEAH box helicase family protein [Ectothiorhodospira sp. 9905]